MWESACPVRDPGLAEGPGWPYWKALSTCRLPLVRSWSCPLMAGVSSRMPGWRGVHLRHRGAGRPARLFGPVASDSTVWRLLDRLGQSDLAQVAAARGHGRLARGQARAEPPERQAPTGRRRRPSQATTGVTTAEAAMRAVRGSSAGDSAADTLSAARQHVLPYGQTCGARSAALLNQEHHSPLRVSEVAHFEAAVRGRPAL
jgi:hypothetical protein